MYYHLGVLNNYEFKFLIDFDNYFFNKQFSNFCEESPFISVFFFRVHLVFSHTTNLPTYVAIRTYIVTFNIIINIIQYTLYKYKYNTYIIIFLTR